MLMSLYWKGGYAEMEAKPKTVWYARGGGISKCGPFKTQEQAIQKMRLAKDRIVEPAFPYPQDLFVWPEKAQQEESK